MSADPLRQYSDAELLAIAEERATRGRKPIVRLGPDSPLRPLDSRLRADSPAEPRRGRGHPKGTKYDRDYEHKEQVELFKWADANAPRCPALARLFAVPNGGYRTVASAGRLKAEGVKPGIPDVMLLIARAPYHGLMVELKRPGGTLSPAQADWHYAFTADGFKVAIAITWQQARDHICAYLEISHDELTIRPVGL